MGEVMRRAHNRGAALNSEKNTYFLACDVDSNNYSFLNSTSIVTRRSIFVFRRRRVRAHTVNHQTRKLVLMSRRLLSVERKVVLRFTSRDSGKPARLVDGRERVRTC